MKDPELISTLFRAQGGRCAGGTCRRSLATNPFHIDHIIPRALGGVDGRRNRQLLCSPCNIEKRDRHPVDFYRSRGFLL